jgi:hypothetical protein
MRDAISRIAKTEPSLVIQLDQEIARLNERLRQLRALSPEQRIKHFATYLCRNLTIFTISGAGNNPEPAGHA